MNKISVKVVLIFFIFWIGLERGMSQHLNLYQEFFLQQNINAQINKSDEIIHSAFKPLMLSQLEEYGISDSISYTDTRDKLFSDKFKQKWIYRKVRTEDFIIHQSKNFNLKINPLLDLSYKRSPDYNQTYFNNTRGIEFKGDIGKRFSFYTSFYENEARFAPFITDFINQYRVAPGQGAVKILDNNKFDFSRASAYFTVKASKNITIQAGHYKHFIGEGYRSLLLSDNSFIYPYVRISVKYRKLKYTILWNQYQLFEGAYYNYHRRKYGSISYLSWAPKPGFEFGLFESVMWPGNTPEEKNNFNLNFFNPVILSHLPFYGLNSKKNILLGINSRIKIYKFAQFYAQFALDNIDANISANNNYAFQLGFKHFDLFHQKLRNQTLFVHAEYNFITPYTYTHKEVQQSYSHYNQPITHPNGSGLKELLATAKYSFKDLKLDVRGCYLINSIDTTSTNFGSDIFLSNEIQTGIVSHTGNTPGQGIKNELLHLYSELSFTINPATNMRFFIALHIRENTNQLLSERKTFYSVGIKTNINNYYYDF